MEVESQRQLVPSLGRWQAPIAFGLLALVMLLAYAFFPRDGAKEIRDLPSNERAAFIERTVATLRTTCARTTGPSLTSYCAEQAAIVLRLPECDVSCRALATKFTSKPTR